MDHVFISYASGDLAKVDSFRQLLLQQSIPCWMAPYDIPAGQRYAYAVTTSLRHCACAVILYSAKAMQSENVERELECAVNFKKPIVPIALEETPLSDNFLCLFDKLQKLKGVIPSSFFFAGAWMFSAIPVGRQAPEPGSFRHPENPESSGIPAGMDAGWQQQNPI